MAEVEVPYFGLRAVESALMFFLSDGGTEWEFTDSLWHVH